MNLFGNQSQDKSLFLSIFTQNEKNEEIKPKKLGLNIENDLKEILCSSDLIKNENNFIQDISYVQKQLNISVLHSENYNS